MDDGATTSTTWMGIDSESGARIMRGFFTVSGFKTIFHSCRDRRHKNAFLYFKYTIRKNPKIFHALHSGFVHQVNVYLSTVVNDS